MDEAGEKLKRAFTGAFALLFAEILTDIVKEGCLM